MTGADAPDPAYIAARRVLLDALNALGPHRASVVLVGAQAIYLHVGDGERSVDHPERRQPARPLFSESHPRWLRTMSETSGPPSLKRTDAPSGLPGRSF